MPAPLTHSLSTPARAILILLTRVRIVFIIHLGSFLISAKPNLTLTLTGQLSFYKGDYLAARAGHPLPLLTSEQQLPESTGGDPQISGL